MNFKSFLEALKFNEPRTQLQNHPQVTEATFGLEIEFATISPPEDEVGELDILAALRNSKRFQEQVKAELNNPDEDDDDPDDKQMLWYINSNKRECFRMIYELVEENEFDPGMSDNQYQSRMLDHYYYYISQDITRQGFKILKGQTAANGIWAMGVDGYEKTYNVPVMEIRTSILTKNDLPKLYAVLTELSKSFKAYNKEILITGNTGVHIHIGNSKTTDGFTRLAIASNADEDAIWNTELKTDRDFASHAKLGRQHDFSSYSDTGANTEIARKLKELTKKQNPFYIPLDKFTAWVNDSMDRNFGINVKSRQPTVEYRHLSTQTLKDNPKKIIEYINYFIDHTAQQSNKDQITFEDHRNYDRITITKLQNQVIRIDSYKSNNKPKTPRANMPAQDLNQKQGRGNTPIKQWWKEMPWEDRWDLKDKIRKKFPEKY